MGLGRSSLLVLVLVVASLSSAGLVAAGPTTTTTTPTPTPTPTTDDGGVSKADVMEIVADGSDVTHTKAETVYDWVTSNDLSVLSDSEARMLYRWTIQRASTDRIPTPVIEDVTSRVDPAAAERIAEDVTDDLPKSEANRVLAAVEETGASWTSSLSTAIEDATQTTKSSTSEESASPTTESGEWTYDELKQGGKRYEGAPPSMRWLGDYGSVTVRYTPVGLGSSGWSYLKPGSTLNTNEVTLKSVRLEPKDELDETLNVTVVSWKTGEKQVTRGNTTSTVTVAKNVSAFTKEVELGRGYDTANITLPAHYASTYHVTMLVEGYDGSRWVFDHHSVKSSQGVPFAPTWAGFWSFVSTNILLPILGLTGAVALTVPAAVRRTGRGPNKGLLFWFLALAITGGIVAGGAYVWTTSLLASAPWVVAVLIAGVIGIVMLETMEYGVDRVAFMRLFTEETQNPGGDLAAEANGGEFEIATVADTDDGVIALTDGIRPWLARLWCGGARLKGAERLQNEFTLSKPELSLTQSVASKLVFVDGDSNALVTYEPEHLEFDLPLTRDDSVYWPGITSVGFYGVLGGALGYGASMAIGMPSMLFGVLGGLLSLGLTFTTAVDGVAAFMPAVGNTQDAVATAMYYESEVDSYETLETALEALIDERNSEDELIAKLDELDDENLIKRAHERDGDASGFVDGSKAAGDD